ncbi:MAG: gliding motility-associated C-terminal domain-containing protein, partial [Bacteroidota bacterium]
PAVLADASARIAAVCVELEHPIAANVHLSLRAPNGQTLDLTSGNGGSAAGITNLCFTPSASQNITGATAPLSGDYQPEGNWNALDGVDINGSWTLILSDNGPDDIAGFIRSWHLRFVNENEVSYRWTGASDLSCTDCPTPTITPSSPSVYEIQVTDSYNCQDTASIRVDWSSNIEAPMVDCTLSGPDAITFSWPAVSGADRYEVSLDGGLTWVAANGPNFHIISGLTPTVQVNLEVRGVSDGNFCLAVVCSGSCLFEGCLFMVDTFSTSNPSCHNTDDGSVLLFDVNANGNVNYFLNGNGPIVTSLIENLSAGTYQLTAVDAIGCQSQIDFTLASPNPIQIILVADSVKCSGGSDGKIEAVVSGGTAAYQFDWSASNAPDDFLLENIPAGLYGLTVTDARGCTAEAAIAVGAPLPLRATASTTEANCKGDNTGQANASAQGGTPPYTYRWNTGQTGADVNGLLADDYEVTITDRNGCTAIAAATVEEPLFSLEGSISQTAVGCNGANQNEATLVPNGGTAPYTLRWSNGQTSLTAVDLGDDTYTVTLTDSFGCTFETSITTNSLDPIEFAMITSDPSCFGSSNGQIELVDIKGGIGNADPANYQYNWDIPGAKEESIVGGLAGDSTYSVTVTDQQGCSAIQQTSLQNPSNIELSFDTNASTCYDGTDGKIEVIASGGVGNFQYLWDAQTGGATSASVENLAASTYLVTVTDGNGCTQTGGTTITEAAPIELTFDYLMPSCADDANGSISASALGGTPGYTWQWSNGGNLPNLEELRSDWYTVRVIDGKGCVQIDSFFLPAPPPIVVDLAISDPLCHGDENGQIRLEASGGQGGFRYRLNDGPLQGGNLFNGLAEGDYELWVEDQEGCAWSSVAQLKEPALFQLSFEEEYQIDLGDSVALAVDPVNAAGRVNWYWEQEHGQSLHCEDSLLSCAAPFAKPLYTTTYRVFALDENGCEAEGKILIRVVKERNIFVPTGFSPNGDNVNDLLLVHGKESRKAVIKYFRVYDKWGEMVFEANDFTPNDPNIGWDGKLGSEPMNPGVFVWVLEAEFEDGYREVFKGSTTLLR